MKSIVTTLSIAFCIYCFLPITVWGGASEVIVAADKETALKACEEKAENSPENTREAMLSSCRCIVERADFDKIEQYSQAGDNDAMRALYEEAGEACQSEPEESPN